MLLDQGMQIDIGKNVAAINDERFCAERRFGVLDPAACFQEDRFIFKFDWLIAIARALESFRKTGGVKMSVHNKPRATGCDQMVEGESDQRFLKDRDERFRKFFRQREEALAQTSAENESLFDHERWRTPWSL